MNDPALKLVQDIINATEAKWSALNPQDWESRNGAGVYCKTVRTVTLTKHPEGFSISDSTSAVDLREKDYIGVRAYAEAVAAFDRQRKNAQREGDIARLRAAAGFL